MLCYDGQLGNNSVFTHFHSDSSTATSGATSKYGTVPERPNRNEEPTSSIEEQTRNVPSSYIVLPHNLFSELLYILPVLEHETLNYLARFLLFSQ